MTDPRETTRAHNHAEKLKNREFLDFRTLNFWICPTTQEIPVMSRQTSPKTHEVLENHDMIPNILLKDQPLFHGMKFSPRQLDAGLNLGDGSSS